MDDPSKQLVGHKRGLSWKDQAIGYACSAGTKVYSAGATFSGSVKAVSKSITDKVAGTVYPAGRCMSHL